MIKSFLNEFLVERAYQFYPRNIPDFGNERYKNSKEHLKLIEKCKDYHENDKFWRSFKQEMKRQFPNFRLFDNSLLQTMERCYYLTILYYEDKKKVVTLNINISIIIPYYHIYILEGEIEDAEDQRWALPFKYSDDFLSYGCEKDISLIRDAIESIFTTNKFPKYLLNNVIPDISFDNFEFGEFTFLNAFFHDNYRIRI